MTAGRHSRNYAGGLFQTWERIRLNTHVARFPLSWQAKLNKKLGRAPTADNLRRWAEVVDKLCASERGGLRPDASDSEICTQADITARDFGRRIMQWRAIITKGLRLEPLRERFGARFESFYVAGQCIKLLERRGLVEYWPGNRGEVGRWADVARMSCIRFWRRVYRRLHAATVGAVEVGIGLVRKNAGLYCSDDQVKRSKATDVRCTAVLESVVAVNDHQQAYNLAELAAKGVANQEIRRHELLTRIAGFELIAKDCGHMGVMVTVTCPSRFHAATTRADGRVIDNPKYQDLTPRDGQENLALKWSRCRSAAARAGLEWYGFRIAEPQHDGTPHWHILLFMPRSADGFDAYVLLQALVRKYFLDQDEPWESGAQKYRVDFEAIDWNRGSAVGYVIKYISKNIDGHGVGLDLFGNDAVTSSQRVRAWARQWRIRQFQQVGGAPVTVWRELRRVHPENIPDTAPEPLRQALSAMNIAAVEPGVQALAWAKYNAAQGGVSVCRRDRLIKLIKEKLSTKTRYGEPSPDRTIGVWSEGVELFHNHIHQMDPKAAPFSRPLTLEVESERAHWLMGGHSKAAALAVAAVVFERIGAAERTRIHVNNCTGPRDWSAPPPSMFGPVRRRVHKLRRFGWHETAPADPGSQKE